MEVGMKIAGWFLLVALLYTPTNPSCVDNLTTAESLNSGIFGKILIGPMCPGPQRVDENCDEPYQATVIVRLKKDGKEVTRFTSNEKGEFRVPLPAGEYRLIPLSRGKYPHASPVTVTVPENKWVFIEIHYDSGIR